MAAAATEQELLSVVSAVTWLHLRLSSLLNQPMPFQRDFGCNSAMSVFLVEGSGGWMYSDCLMPSAKRQDPPGSVGSSGKLASFHPE